MALMLRVGDKSAGVGQKNETETIWLDTSSPQGITSGTINNKEHDILFDRYRSDSHMYNGVYNMSLAIK